MATIEFWARLGRLVFVILLLIAGYSALINLIAATAEESALTFLKGMFWPFIIATAIVEIIQIRNAFTRAKQRS
jgi:hypothetical protein